METGIVTHPVEESTKKQPVETGVGDQVSAAEVIGAAEESARKDTERILAQNPDLLAPATEEKTNQQPRPVEKGGVTPTSKKEKKAVPDFRQPSAFQEFGRGTTRGLARTTEKTLTGAKQLVKPYYSSRRDFLDVLQLKMRDKDWEEAKDRGHGWIPKWVCGWLVPFGIANYVGKGLDWLGGPLTKPAWELRQKMGDGVKKITEKPRQAIVRGAKSLAKKVGRFLLGSEQQKKSRMKRKKTISKLRKGIENLDSWMRRPVKFGKKKR